MKKSILIVMSMLFAYSAKAGNVPPVAVLTSTPNQTWFYNLEDVVFSSTSSYDTDGYVNYTRFYINGVLQYSSSYTSSYSACFALHGSPAGSCYQLASGATTVQVKVEVRDNSGAWSSQTKTYTIQAHKGRKYFVKDHLGTVRATVNRDGNVLGYDDYYPFGLVMSGRSNNTGNPNDAYKFTGHERDDEAGLNLMYAGARYSDPVLGGRWLSIDPYAAKFPNLSPYNYSFNNPIRFMDPDGRAPVGCPPCLSPVVTPETAVRVAKVANALLYSFANSVSTEVGRGSSRNGYNFDFDASESEMMTDAFGSETTGRVIQLGSGIFLGLRGNPKKLIDQAGDAANSVANKLRLKAKLSFEEAGILDDVGNLTDDAIKGATQIIPGQRLKNTDVIDALTADGSDIGDWGKFTTNTVDINGTKHQIHFYKNSKTGAINTDIDYKVKNEIKE